MATYHYDEAGSMAAYFIFCVLSMILVPLTMSMFTRTPSRQISGGCQCESCIKHRDRIRKSGRASTLSSKLGTRGFLLLVGWLIVAACAYKIRNIKVESKIYDPFEVLGLRTGVSEKEIKSHFKKLSRIYHPDKVKLGVNETIESAADHFVEITKAYKSLTDETIRRNWELYGHPDGRQEVSMGIALPKWIIEGKNNIWVLGIYGLVFGGALPSLVGRWWFGTRRKTKDGIDTTTAAMFFKSLKEDAGFREVTEILSKAYQWEILSLNKSKMRELDELEAKVQQRLGREWLDIKRLIHSESYQWRALVLLYAHFLRLPMPSTVLQREQDRLLQRTSSLLNVLLTMSIARNWLSSSLAIMRLHAYLIQALLPGQIGAQFAQLTDLPSKDEYPVDSKLNDYASFLLNVQKRGDRRALEVQKVLSTWSSLEVVDMSFKVIGERAVTPSAIVFLVAKLRLTPPLHAPYAGDLNGVGSDESRADEERKDDEFLMSKRDAEDIGSGGFNNFAHAPWWPNYRKPTWWLLLADDKTNKIVVPPIKITDVPLSTPNRERNYRSYKLQFQAPPNVGLFTWKVYLVSDTCVNEELCRNITLHIEDAIVFAANEQVVDDEISEPEEDSIAGQMAAIRGEAVKQRPISQPSDNDSNTDSDSDTGSSASDSD